MGARAVLGHLELDLREARFRDRDADLDITAVCGHVDVLVPGGYAVDMKPPVGIAYRAIEPRALRPPMLVTRRAGG